jgi:hypothetical protein
MARSHTHHADGSGPVCRFTTKKECDENYRAYLAQKKMDYETEQAEKAWTKKVEAERVYDEFVDKEAKRVAQILFTWKEPTNEETERK